MWTTHQTFTAKTTCQTETSKVLVDESYQYFLYSSRAYYFYLDLFENTKKKLPLYMTTNVFSS